MRRKDVSSDGKRQNVFSNVMYHRVRQSDDGFVDSQFQIKLSRIPWKAIALATFLFIMGSLLITLASLILAGFFSEKYYESMWPLYILGALMFIPGAYHVRIAYYAFKKYPGYTFDDIPDFD